MAADRGAGWTGSRRAGTGRIGVRKGATYTKGPGISTTSKGTGAKRDGRSFTTGSHPGRQF